MPKDFNVLTVLALIFVHIYSSLSVLFYSQNRLVILVFLKNEKVLARKTFHFCSFMLQLVAVDLLYICNYQYLNRRN